jgi:hypothetical protein
VTAVLTDITHGFPVTYGLATLPTTGASVDTDDPLVKVAVQATITIRQVPAEQMRIRAQAVWELYHEHEPKWTLMQIANALRDSLILAGWSDAEIKGSGVGFDSVRRICAGPKP